MSQVSIEELKRQRYGLPGKEVVQIFFDPELRSIPMRKTFLHFSEYLVMIRCSAFFPFCTEVMVEHFVINDVIQHIIGDATPV